MKNYVHIVVLIVCMTLMKVGADDQFITSPEFISSMVTNAYKNIKDYQCAFQIRTLINGKVKKKANGKMFFKPGGLMRMNFYHPNGQVICSNGTIIWIYVPKLNMVFSHKLKKDSRGQLTSIVTNMSLFKKYNMSFNTPKVLKKWNVTFYSMKLTPKVTALGFKEINLLVNRQGYIQQISGTNYNGKITEISFLKPQINKSITEDFDFDIPTNSQEISNPFTNLEN